MRIKSVGFLNALKASFEVLSSSSSIATLNRILVDAQQGDFVIFAKYFDNFNISDGSGSADAAVLGFFKTLTDDAGFAEQSYREFMKALNDIGVFTDDDVIAFAKNLADTTRILETHYFDLQKPLQANAASAEDETFVLAKKVKEDTAAFGDQINRRDIAKPTNDTTNIAEAYAADVSKPLPDSTSANAKATLHPTKVSNDGTGAADQIDTRGVGKALAEQPSFAEQITNKDVGKPLSDAGTVAAQIDTKDVGKVSADAAGAADQIDFRAVAKLLLDTVNLTDDVDGLASILDDQELSVFKQITKIAAVSEDFYRQVAYARSLADSSAAQDAIAFELARVFEDAYAAADDAAKATQKPLDDGATINADEYVLAFGKAPSDAPILTESLIVDLAKLLYDASTAADVVCLHVSTQESDTLAVSDVKSLGPNKVLNELASTTDAGSLRSQGYADFTYFAEDYVGASRAF